MRPPFVLSVFANLVVGRVSVIFGRQRLRSSLPKYSASLLHDYKTVDLSYIEHCVHVKWQIPVSPEIEDTSKSPLFTQEKESRIRFVPIRKVSTINNDRPNRVTERCHPIQITRG